MATTTGITVHDLVSGTPEVRRAAEILSNGFTVPMGRVFPKGRVTPELLEWRIAMIERLLKQQSLGCPSPMVVAKKDGGDVIGVAAWVTERHDDDENPPWDMPMPQVPSATGDVDEEVWKVWRRAFVDIRQRYGCDEGGTWVDIKYLAVDGSAQRSGVGSLLMKHILDEVSHLDARILLITAPTPHAVPFYTKHGFEVVERIDALPDLPEGRHCFLMRRGPRVKGEQAQQW